MKVLKPKPKKEIKPIKFIGFDVETDPKNKNSFICACLYCRDFRKVVYSEEELIEEIKKTKYLNYKFVATNLPFDFFASFQDRNKHISITERNGRIYKATFYQKVEENEEGEIIRKKPIHFYDTLNYIPCSVADLGKIVHNPKMEHPYFFPNYPKNNIEMQMLVDYCMNDSAISYMFMEDIIAPWLIKNNLKFKMTIAGISMEDFQTNYLKEKLFVERPEIHKICFSGYYGGRTEVFKRGLSKNVYCYDVNSLYPTAMLKEYPHPNYSKLIKQSSEYIIDNYEGVTKVKVYVPKMKIPPLPYRKNKGDKLIFPCGYFEGYYCHNELRNAKKYGVKILECFDGVIYTKTEKFFEEFVLNHYNNRKILNKEGNPLEVMEKGVLNNLYGKFALNYTQSTKLQHKHDKIDMKDVIRIEPIGDYFSITTEGYDNPPEYSFPILSAYVTAHARIIMYEELHKHQNCLLYTDTDSIFLCKELPSSLELGEFKLEKGYPVKECIFIRPKVYHSITQDDKIKIKLKGMSRVTEKEFTEILEGKTVYQERFMKHRTALRKKLKDISTRINQVILTPKNISLEDDKRVWKNKFNSMIREDSEAIYFSEPITI